MEKPNWLFWLFSWRERFSGGGVRAIFDELEWWMDPVLRTGPENMALDEWLLGRVERPLLRVYGWEGDWGSVGYFGRLAEAQAAFPGISWVRRWTGGGVVDHRVDWTYTLVVPLGHSLASTRGAESYRWIHEVLGSVMEQEGQRARLSVGEEITGAAACFENPVQHDLLDGTGRKLAGAGQRRTREGLLHQGSVAGRLPEWMSFERAKSLAAGLANRAEEVDWPMKQEDWRGRMGRYEAPEWLTRA